MSNGKKTGTAQAFAIVSDFPGYRMLLLFLLITPVVLNMLKHQGQFARSNQFNTVHPDLLWCHHISLPGLTQCPPDTISDIPGILGHKTLGTILGFRFMILMLSYCLNPMFDCV